MINNRSIFAVLVLAVCVVVQAQVPTSGTRTTERPVTGTIDGKVLNESGQPLAGASVFVRAVNATINRTTTTDVDGNFRVNGLETNLYIVSANSPAYTNVPGDLDAPQYYRLGDSARVEMIRGGAITGTVTNALGEPMIAIRVRVVMIRDAKGQIQRTPNLGAFEQPTDDRGIYRIYGLAPGTYLVSAGGSSFFPAFGMYETDIPTFAPSSTRDTAAEVSVRSGEDVAVDIRYRGEPGHTISGSVKILGTGNASLTLTRAGTSISVATTLQLPTMRGFVFSGLSDGEYDLIAQESIMNPPSTQFTMAFSEPKRITVKGADVTGIEVVTKPLGSISGKILFEPTKAPECQGKRPPLLAETLVRFRRPGKESDKDDPLAVRLVSGSASPDTTGAFSLRNLLGGKYQFEPRFYARYWYLQSISMTSAGPKPQRIDAAANWTTLKSGEHLSNLNITLAEGAASIRGTTPATDATLPSPVVVYLIPNDRDKVEDVLRYFVTDVADGTFTFNSVPPGKYLALAQSTVDPQSASLTRLRQPDSAAERTKLRRTAETKKTELELKPCENLVDYQLKQ
jgi:Carboxypeptidase regulatory-like domain